MYRLADASMLWTTTPASRQRQFRSVRDFRCWHETDMPTVLRNVRSLGQSGSHLLALGFSGFDPGPDINALPGTSSDKIGA